MWCHDVQVAYSHISRSTYFCYDFYNGVKNLVGGRLILRKYRAVRYVVETTLGRVRPLHHQRAADDGLLVLQGYAETLVSDAGAKIRVPRRLHETGVRCCLDKRVPGLPSVRFRLEQRHLTPPRPTC